MMNENETITPDGAGESGQTKPKTIIDIEASNRRMRDLLRDIEGMAGKAIISQPDGAGECWRHLSKALSDIRKALRPKAGTLAFEDEWAWYGKQIEELRSRMDPTAGSGAFFTNETVLKDLVGDESHAEPQSRGEGEEKKAIGNFAGQGKVVSYAIGRDMTVTVTASTAGDGEWNFVGIKDCKIVIAGSIFGGKWAAAQYCKFIRNGIVSWAKKVWKNHHRRLKEAAIETITPEDGGSDGAQPSQGEGAAA